MSNAERAWIGMCCFFLAALIYSVVASRGRVQIVLYALQVLLGLWQLRFFRRQRQQRERDGRDDH